MAKTYTVKQAAEVLGINRRSVVAAITRGNLPAEKQGDFLYAIAAKDLAQYKARRDRRLMDQKPASKKRAKPVKAKASPKKKPAAKKRLARAS